MPCSRKRIERTLAAMDNSVVTYPLYDGILARQQVAPNNLKSITPRTKAKVYEAYAQKGMLCTAVKSGLLKNLTQTASIPSSIDA